MKKKSEKKIPIASLEASGSVSIPDIDKGRSHSWLILPAVMGVTEDSFYQLRTSEGILKVSICEITIHFMP